MYLVNRICSWCRTVMGQKEMSAPGDTHGICERCAEKAMRELRRNS